MCGSEFLQHSADWETMQPLFASDGDNLQSAHLVLEEHAPGQNMGMQPNKANLFSAYLSRVRSPGLLGSRPAADNLGGLPGMAVDPEVFGARILATRMQCFGL